MRHPSPLSDRQASWATSDALDWETESNHTVTVTVTATGPDGAADPIRVTVPVTKLDEKGMAALLEMHPGSAGGQPPTQPTWTAASPAQPGRRPVRRPRRGLHGHQQGNASELHVGGD